MKILLSNDDGYFAPGVKTLAAALAADAAVTVVAPDRNRSGASSSLTLSDPLRVKKADNGFYFVNGTPADCVQIGINTLMDDPPDMVVAGINAGANLGDDVLYSGTVAAAIEGRFLGAPAVAISLTDTENGCYDIASEICLRIIKLIMESPLPDDSILNVNVPGVPKASLRGVRSTRLGCRHAPESVRSDRDPYGNRILWMGPAGRAKDNTTDTDFYAIENNYVSITPLHVDMTRHQQLPKLEEWLKPLNA